MSDHTWKASLAVKRNSEQLAESIVKLQYDRQRQVWQPYGESGLEKSLRDMGYHLVYLAEALAVSEPHLFADYVAWLKELFTGLQFHPETLTSTLDCMRDVLQQSLPTELSIITNEYIAAGQARLLQISSPLPTHVDEDKPLASLARQYLDALLRGERHIASQLILDAVERGTRVKDLYLHVFQCTQYEIGRLWQSNEISVAQEHYCTAATQLIMSQLYPHIFRTDRIDRRLVATCVGDELHELGVRMVADFFEMEGWDTYYLGANTPADSILRTIVEKRADLLGISATMTFRITDVSALIAQIRKSDAGRAIRILVGGYPFNVAPELWRQVGADGWAHNAQEAVELANRMLGAES